VALFFRRFLVVSISYLPQESHFEFGAKLTKTDSRSKIKKTKSYISAMVMSISELIQVGIIAPPAIFIFAEMGSSMHFGSSFPPGSVSDSQANVSDEYGRVYGMQRIHLIDGSVLPNVIVGPPTLTIMANSMRIVRRVLSHLD
jgi:choline dehydrogenase-like flavoprotein